MTCMTPRAFADETMALLKPLSCHAIAAASDGETPCCAAIDCTSAALTRPGAGAGPACGTTVSDGAGVDSAAGGVGDPVGSLMTVPASSVPSSDSPFIAAMCDAGTPETAARPDSVSPGRTVYAPIGDGAEAGVEATVVVSGALDDPLGRSIVVPA